MAREAAAAETKRFGRSAGHALARDRVGGPAHLRLLLARLPQPRQGGLRRGGRPVVGGLRARSRSCFGRSSSCSRGRSPSVRRTRSRSASRCGSRRRSSSAWRALSRWRRWPFAARSRTTSCPETRRSTGSSSPRSSPSRRASSPGASSPAAGGSVSTGRCCSPSRPRGCRSPWRSPSGSPAGRPRSRSGSSPRPLLSLDGRPARLRGPRGARAARPGAAAHAGIRGPSSLSRQGGGFAAAVLLIMVSEQTLLNAGPLLVRASEGAAAAGLHLQRADDRPRPAASSSRRWRRASCPT